MEAGADKKPVVLVHFRKEIFFIPTISFSFIGNYISKKNFHHL
jgi:hypothetical protein